MNKDAINNFLIDSENTGRFIVTSFKTGRKYYVEPLEGDKKTIWGDINPVTKKLEGDYGAKHKGAVKASESLITKDNGFDNIVTLDPGYSPLDYLKRLTKNTRKMKSKFEWKVPHLEIKKGEWYVCTNSWSDDGWTKFTEGDVVQAVEDYCFIDCYNIKHYFRKDGVCYFRPADDDEIPDVKSEEEIENEKNLLIKDLCARLPYGVKAFECWGDCPFTIVSYEADAVFIDNGGCEHSVDTFKPYLRTMDMMTREEFNLLCDWLGYHVEHPEINLFMKAFMVGVSVDSKFEFMIDFFNSHHFDYRGLIEKGLALKAPEDMYKK